MPAPGFQHTLSLSAPTATSTDAEGRSVTTYGTAVEVVGRAAMADFAEVDRAGAGGVRFDAVALVPHGTSIDTTTRVVVADVGPPLDGTYRVVAVRHTVLHLRALLRREEP